MRTKLTTTMKARLRFLLVLLSLLFIPGGMAYAWDWEWTDEWGVAEAWCDDCGATYTVEGMQHTSDAEEALSEFFCDDCGYCSREANEECWFNHHCCQCEACVDEGDFCEGCFNDNGVVICHDCKMIIELQHCPFCEGHFGTDVEECGCVVDYSIQHCTDCEEVACKECGAALVIAGEEFSWAACLEHELCVYCVDNDPDHCRECHYCDEEICPECGLCESCASYEEHCPECNTCFGEDGVEMCYYGGDHCVQCCEENGWTCDLCGRCVEGLGIELCDECGYCEICCSDFTENEENCDHGYCIFSSDFADHLCPNCMQCPHDTECEYCGLCEDCQEDYHCEHGICPDGDEWEEHLCTDCGDCFEEDELCEFCGKCENCAESYHCEHGFCPDDSAFEDDFSHFICSQCDNCYDGDLERCDICELCEDCCAANTESMGCDHGLCVESDEFAEHWCYADDQCLEYCDHNEDCAHNNVSTDWESDGNAHWQVCDDCGAAVNKAIHTEGAQVIITDPNPVAHTNGKASVSCTVCDRQMAIVTVPYVEIPTDGSPYIVTQPRDYTGKTNTSAFLDVPDLMVTFTVRAGGKDLSYQWYEKMGSGEFKPIADTEGRHEGTQTASLTTLVYTDDCDDSYDHKFYCVVSNSSGSVTTNTVSINAQHVFGNYLDNGDGTHRNACFGECDAVKKNSKHRFGEWELDHPATETQEGLRVQKCMDCGAKNKEIIPKVEPGHVHAYNVPKYTVTIHWFECSCGIKDPEGEAGEHTLGEPVVTKEPTEKTLGEQTLTCTVCGYTKTEKISKLEHTHEYYDFSYEVWNDPAKGGYSAMQHYVCCTSGDGQIKAEPHDFEPWRIGRKATASQSGTIERSCVWCPYVETKYYKFGTYPIMVEGGRANYDAAEPGTLITVTFRKSPGYKFGWWKDMGEEGVGLVPVTLSDMNSPVVTFTMPNGTVGLEAYVSACHHEGETEMGSSVSPTCTGYGHEPDVLCAECGAVVEEGERIPAPGHDLSATPILGTVVDEYCTVEIDGDRHANPKTHGYSGDVKCNRCHLIIKGKSTPLKHGLFRKWYNSSEDFGEQLLSGPNYQTIEGFVQATCTTDGNTGDIYCDFCSKRASRGEKIARTGHDWGEWEVVREATTKVKGMEKRVCNNDPTHEETQITDYSGPDYDLRANKTKLNFTFTYGETIEPQTVTFRSVGRNEVTALSKAVAQTIGDVATLSVDGLTLTIAPIHDAVIEKMLDGEIETIAVESVIADGAETTEFIAPEITFTVKMKKAEPTIELAADEVIGYYGTPIDAPEMTLVPADMTLEWKSSDNNVATVDAATGVVTPLGVGTTTITASFEGNRFYKSGSASYQVTIKSAHFYLDPDQDIAPYENTDKVIEVDADDIARGIIVEYAGREIEHADNHLTGFRATATIEDADGNVFVVKTLGDKNDVMEVAKGLFGPDMDYTVTIQPIVYYDFNQFCDDIYKMWEDGKASHMIPDPADPSGVSQIPDPTWTLAKCDTLWSQQLFAGNKRSCLGDTYIFDYCDPLPLYVDNLPHVFHIHTSADVQADVKALSTQDFKAFDRFGNDWTAEFLSAGGTATRINRTGTVAEDKATYTIGGQRISKPTQRGVYVEKGKKVVVK